PLIALNSLNAMRPRETGAFFFWMSIFDLSDSRPPLTQYGTPPLTRLSAGRAGVFDAPPRSRSDLLRGVDTRMGDAHHHARRDPRVEARVARTRIRIPGRAASAD